MTIIYDRACTEIRNTGQTNEDVSVTRRLSEMRSVPAYVLLGDPGLGKSTAFGSECRAEGETAILLDARDFLALDLDNHPEWHGKTLFIDGLDEVRAGAADARTALDEIRGRLDALGQPRFRISCREADWLGDNDRRRLARVSSSSEVRVLRLNPLSDDEIERILQDHPQISDSAGLRPRRARAPPRQPPGQPPDAQHVGRRRRRRGGLAGEPRRDVRQGLQSDGDRKQRGVRPGRSASVAGRGHARCWPPVRSSTDDGSRRLLTPSR